MNKKSFFIISFSLMCAFIILQLVSAEVAEGLVTLQKSDGTYEIFSAENNDDARGSMLIRVQSLASSGDTIVVNAGNYKITSSLGKNGVDWYFYPNSHVYSHTTNIWADGGNDYEFDVGGYAVFTNSGNPTNGDMIARFQGNSKVSMEFDAASAHQGRGFVTFDPGSKLILNWRKTISAQDGTFDNVGGTMILTGKRAESTGGFVLEMDGDLIISHIDEIESFASNPIEVSSQGQVLVYDAKIIAPQGGIIALNSVGDGGLYIFNSVLDSDVTPFEGEGIVVSNVVRLNGEEFLGNEVTVLSRPEILNHISLEEDTIVVEKIKVNEGYYSSLGTEGQTDEVQCSLDCKIFFQNGLYVGKKGCTTGGFGIVGKVISDTIAGN